MSKKFLIVAFLAVFAAGWFASSLYPRPPDRPVLKALARFAKVALWFAAFAEPAPDETEQHQSVMLGEDGYVQINHARGW